MVDAVQGWLDDQAVEIERQSDGTEKKIMGKEAMDILTKLKRGGKDSLARLKQNIKTNEKYQLNNLDFKVVEFDHFKMQAGLPSFVLSPGQWIKKTSAIGIYVRSGRYGGTYAHKDIAFEFCSAINPVFKLYLIKEFQRLKSVETRRQQLEWSVSRTLSKVNYLVHTNAVKEHLIPDDLSRSKQRFVYAN